MAGTTVTTVSGFKWQWLLGLGARPTCLLHLIRLTEIVTLPITTPIDNVICFFFLILVEF